MVANFSMALGISEPSYMGFYYYTSICELKKDIRELYYILGGFVSNLSSIFFKLPYWRELDNLTEIAVTNLSILYHPVVTGRHPNFFFNSRLFLVAIIYSSRVLLCISHKFPSRKRCLLAPYSLYSCYVAQYETRLRHWWFWLNSCRYTSSYSVANQCFVLCLVLS